MSSRVWSPKEGELPPEKMEILHELEEAFHGDRVLINEYLTRFGWSKVIAPNIRIVKREHAEHENAPRIQQQPGEDFEQAPTTPESEGLKSCYYEVDARCVFCGTAFRPSLLRSKSLILSYSYKDPEFPLLVPEAHAAMRGFILEDPLIRGVIVCPHCLFASTSLGCFQTDSAVSGTRGLVARLPERKMGTLRKFLSEDLSNRREIRQATLSTLAGAGEGENRGKALSLVAYRLASHCSEILTDYEPTEHFRAGESLLSAARLAYDLGKDDLETTCLSGARPHLERAYEAGSVSALPVYLLGVVLFHLGDDMGARTWIGRVLTDRGKLVAAVKYKRYCENLNERIKALKGAS